MAVKRAAAEQGRQEKMARRTQRQALSAQRKQQSALQQQNVLQRQQRRQQLKCQKRTDRVNELTTKEFGRLLTKIDRARFGRVDYTELWTKAKTMAEEIVNGDKRYKQKAGSGGEPPLF